MKWIILLLALSSAAALNVSYDSVVIAEPGSPISINLYVLSEDDARILTGCESGLNISCPDVLNARGGEETNFTIRVVPSIGEEPLLVSLGDVELRIMVKGSRNIGILKNVLDRYNTTFSNLEKKYGPDERIALALSLVEEGYRLYNEGEYLAVEGVGKNLDALLKDYYSSLPARDAPEEPSRLGMGALIPLALVVLAAAYIRRRKYEPGEQKIGELASLITREGENIGGR